MDVDTLPADQKQILTTLNQAHGCIQILKPYSQQIFRSIQKKFEL